MKREHPGGIPPTPLQTNIREAVELLQVNGWTCEPPAQAFPWETPREFVTRHGVTFSHFHRRITEAGCPPYECRMGKRRILSMRSNATFEAFMKKRV